MVQPDQPHGPFPLAHLRAGLSQMLRCYDQAGIKRFPATPSWDVDTAYALAMSNVALPDTAAISANLQQAVTQVEDEAATTRALAASHAATASTPANENTVALENTVAAENIATIESSAQAIQNIPTHWQLPVLDATTRASRLQEIENTVRACRLCEELVGYRRQTVFGEGHLQPRVCFYGEAPGADEDAQGRPFVGAAGKLLTDIIHAMGLERSEVYILNSLKCRPPQNRTPLPEEVQACRPFAIEQLEILQPEVIVLLGAVAVRSVLDRAEPVGRLRGRFHTFRGARVLVTYHPAYLLRNPAAKKQVWEDMQIIMRELGLQPRTRK